MFYYHEFNQNDSDLILRIESKFISQLSHLFYIKIVYSENVETNSNIKLREILEERVNIL